MNLDSTKFDQDWSHSPNHCCRCGSELRDEADEECHYFHGLCSWCYHQWYKLLEDDTVCQWHPHGPGSRFLIDKTKEDKQ
jgi:hypothetical protein